MVMDSRTEQQIRLLSESANRAVLEVLDEAGRPLRATELAERLVDRDVAVVPTDEYDDRTRRTALSLHHDRLPRLAEAGLLEYDPGANVVAAGESAGADLEWHDATSIEDLAAHLPAGPDGEGDTGVIEGRDAIVRYGRRLADRADEELFCMYVDADLLEEECVRRAERAMDRGVTMYLGSRTPEVREFTRRRLPEATVWEPQLDWTNAPTGPRVGRLVLVDRRTVMLAILEERDAGDARPEETAVVASGRDHPLVVLVRELLGSRLDHLDYQSEDFRSELPS